MDYATLKKINSIKSQQKEVPEHVSHTNEFQHSQLKCNNSLIETLCPDVMNYLVKMSILEMKSKITYE